MMRSGSLGIEELVEAFVELNGESSWREINKRVLAKRSYVTDHYKDRYNFEQSLRQLLHRHCPGFAKFSGNAIFADLGDQHYRLLDFNPLTPTTPERKAEEVDELESVARRMREIQELNRNLALVLRLKGLYDHQCQRCGTRLLLPSGEKYSEAHHVQGLGDNGPDLLENMLCLCPNCHVLLDLKAVPIELAKLHVAPNGHSIGTRFIDHHNDLWRKRWSM